ncbi:MAG: hypothetical protein K2N35_03740 [Muribaculaceae bacterium]|nr:hypothetical protein [Muribaculaceae bacterium]
MADLYNTVKKQGEQIDDLQKNVSNHTTRIETLETRAMATPPPQPVNPDPIKVELPADIATNTSIRKMLAEGIPKLSDSELLKKVLSYLPEATATAVGKAVATNVNMEVKDTLRDGIREEFADERKELRDIVSDLRYRVQTMVSGQWWLTIPKWVFILFAVLFIAAIGFGYGFFHELDENSRLTETEWLYRRERTLYRTEKELQLLLNHEKEFFTGTTHEQDSIKDLIRYWEQKGGLDKTFLYFSPTED